LCEEALPAVKDELTPPAVNEELTPPAVNEELTPPAVNDEFTLCVCVSTDDADPVETVVGTVGVPLVIPLGTRDPNEGNLK
jgi:hypothetical protein